MVPIHCLRDGRRHAARVTAICLLANLSLIGCAVSPADDRRRLSHGGLRDAGRDYDQEDDDLVPITRARDGGSDARAASAGSGDGGGLRDAARLHGETDAAPVSPPAVIPNTPVSVGTPLSAPESGDRTRGEGARDDDPDADENLNEESDGESSSDGRAPRTRDGERDLPPTTPRDRSGRSVSPPRCRSLTDCPASACPMTEAQCCRSDNTCGCAAFFIFCR